MTSGVKTLDVTPLIGVTLHPGLTRRLPSWTTECGPAHHIIDPRTGESAEPVWAQVTCASSNAVEANAASAAAIVLAQEAPEWLAQRGIPAMLIDQDGRRVRTPRWAPQRSAA